MTPRKKLVWGYTPEKKGRWIHRLGGNWVNVLVEEESATLYGAISLTTTWDIIEGGVS